MNDPFDKSLVAWYAVPSAALGMMAWRAKVFLPLVPLWVAPAVTVLSQL